MKSVCQWNLRSLTISIFFTILYTQNLNKIWSEPCNNDDFSDWSIHTDGIINLQYGSQQSGTGPCSIDGYCWRICGDSGANGVADGYVYTIIPTTGYENISFTYDMDPHDMGDPSDYCSLQMSIDGSAYSQFASVTGGATHIVAETAKLPSNADDVAMLYIKLVIARTTSQCCHPSRLNLFGTPIITTINVIWNDDYKSWRWQQLLGMTQKQIVTIGSSGTYHGPYRGERGGAVSEPETITLKRSFQCTQQSLVTMTFTVYTCATESSEDSIDVFMNNTLMDTVIVDPVLGSSWNDNILQTVSACSPWFAVGLKGPYQIDRVHAYEIFTVKFVILQTSNTEASAISNVQIKCSGPTIDPTIVPTINPTIVPTINPTIFPTIDPTIFPTIDPTIDPTIVPTIYLTIDPTSDPSINPTADPTLSPSAFPTKTPTAEGAAPIETLSTEPQAVDDVSLRSRGENFDNIIIYVVIIVGICLCLICMVVIYLFLKKQKKEEMSKVDIHSKNNGIMMTTTQNNVRAFRIMSASEKDDELLGNHQTRLPPPPPPPPNRKMRNHDHDADDDIDDDVMVVMVDILNVDETRNDNIGDDEFEITEGQTSREIIPDDDFITLGNVGDDLNQNHLVITSNSGSN